MPTHAANVRWPGRTLYRIAQRVVACDISRLLLLDRSHLLTPEVERRFTFRLLEPGEIERFAADPHNDLSVDLAARMQAGRDMCYAAFSQERLAAYIWLALGSIEAEHNRGPSPRSGVAVSFPADAAFVYKAFTRAEVRGQRLYPAMLASSLELLASRGISRLITTADWTNHAALNSCNRLGFENLGTIVRFACGPAGCTFKPRRARDLGICLGRSAHVDSRTAVDSSPQTTPESLSPEPELCGATASLDI